MLYKRAMLLLGVLCLAAAGFTQRNAQPGLKDGASLQRKVYDYMRAHGRKALENLSEDGCFFVRFTIDGKGRVTGLASNSGAYRGLDTLVKAAIAATSGQWLPKNGGREKMARPFLLPVIFRAGGPNGWTAKPAAEVLAKMPEIDVEDLMQAKTRDTLRGSKGMVDNFLHMIDFPGDNATRKRDTFECILLSPVYLEGPVT